MKSLNPEVIRALTPIFLASVGASIGIVALFAPSQSEAKWSAGLGLASTAIAGAAGLAQTSKQETDFSVRQQKDDLQIKTPSDKEHDAS